MNLCRTTPGSAFARIVKARRPGARQELRSDLSAPAAADEAQPGPGNATKKIRGQQQTNPRPPGGNLPFKTRAVPDKYEPFDRDDFAPWRGARRMAMH